MIIHLLWFFVMSQWPLTFRGRFSHSRGLDRALETISGYSSNFGVENSKIEFLRSFDMSACLFEGVGRVVIENFKSIYLTYKWSLVVIFGWGIQKFKFQHPSVCLLGGWHEWVLNLKVLRIGWNSPTMMFIEGVLFKNIKFIEIWVGGTSGC